MSTSRIYQATPLTSGSEIILDDDACHHLRVLRAKVNDVITLFNGQGGEYQATLTQITKKSMTALIGAFNSETRESPLDLWLAQGISRGEKMDYTMQKAVELGVKKLIPLLTERSTVKLDPERKTKRLEHWQAIVKSAAEQSGRTVLPEVETPISFNEWLNHLPKESALVLLAPEASVSFNKLSLPSSKRLIVLVGPEGGFSPQEIELAIKKGFKTFGLGPRIFRTETAGVVALGILQYLLGDIGNF